jgi:hypothetical protein
MLGVEPEEVRLHFRGNGAIRPILPILPKNAVGEEVGKEIAVLPAAPDVVPELAEPNRDVHAEYLLVVARRRSPFTVHVLHEEIQLLLRGDAHDSFWCEGAEVRCCVVLWWEKARERCVHAQLKRQGLRTVVCLTKFQVISAPLSTKFQVLSIDGPLLEPLRTLFNHRCPPPL